jgi:hypothetical protein
MSIYDVFAERRTRCALPIAATAAILATCGSGWRPARAGAAPRRAALNHEVAVTISPQPSGHSLPPAFVGTLRAYAVQSSGGSLSVVLDNLGGPITLALDLPRREYRSGSETTLKTSSDRGLAATSGITLGEEVPVSAETAVILRIR